jgi:hypothetical protein
LGLWDVSIHFHSGGLKFPLISEDCLHPEQSISQVEKVERDAATRKTMQAIVMSGKNITWASRDRRLEPGPLSETKLTWAACVAPAEWICQVSHFHIEPPLQSATALLYLKVGVFFAQQG